MLGDDAKAAEMNGIADNVKSAILNTLWADGPVSSDSGPKATGPRVPGELGNALKLSGSGEYVNLPTGIVSGLNGDFTIYVWVNPDDDRTWSRVSALGSGNS